MIHLDKHSIDLFTQGNLGAMNFTLFEIVTKLQTEYGQLSPSDLTQILQKATAVFTGGNVRIFLLESETYYAELEANGESVSNAQKLRYLSQSFKNHQEYLSVILTWERKYTTPVAQRSNYDKLILRLKDEYAARQVGHEHQVTVQNRQLVNEDLQLNSCLRLMLSR